MQMNQDQLTAAASLRDDPRFGKVLGRIVQLQEDALNRVLTVDADELPGARAELKAYTHLHQELTEAPEVLRSQKKPIYGNTGPSGSHNKKGEHLR